MDVIVELSKEEISQMLDAAKHRWLIKMGSKNSESYEIGLIQGRLEHDFMASWRAASTEWAVAKFLGQSWNGQITYPNSEHKRRSEMADVGTNIEVRSRRRRDGIPVGKKDILEGKILVGAEMVDPANFNEVRIFGWLEMTAVPEVSEWDENIKKYYVPIEAFKDIRTL